MHNMFDDFRVALHSGDLQHAERLAVNQLALLGESAKWLNNLGLVYVAQGRMAEALLHFDRAVASDHSFIEPLLNGAVVLADLGFYDEAAIRYEAAQQIEAGALSESNKDPSSVPLSLAQSTLRGIGEQHLEIGRVHRITGSRDAAIAEIQKAAEQGNLPSAYIELARIHLESGEIEKSLENLELARKLDPQNPEIHIIAAQCHLLKNRLKEAQDALTRAEVLNDRSRTGAALRRCVREAGS